MRFVNSFSTALANPARGAAALLAASAAFGFAAPAHAGDPAGRVQVKILGTAVLPDGAISEVERDLVPLPAGAQTEADDNFTPTAAVEYFFTPNFSIETIAGVTQHDVTGTGAIAGAALIADANIIPATITAKLHLPTGGGFKPYIGAGPAYFFIFGEDPDAGARALGVTRVNLSEELGFALQAGVDIAIGGSGIGLGLDAKRYFIGTTASFFAGDTLALQTDHELDPWVLSVGLTYRF